MESGFQPKNLNRDLWEWHWLTTRKLSCLLWFQPHLLLKLDQNPKGHFSDSKTFYSVIVKYWSGQKMVGTKEIKNYQGEDVSESPQLGIRSYDF